MEGEAITFNGYDLPTFYIAKQNYSGGVAHIEAFDRCKNLDIPFDHSGFYQFAPDGAAAWFSTSLVVSAIAQQCGFTSGGYSGRLYELCYNDFASKSCRQILTDLSKTDIGHWICSSENSLVFVPFNPDGTGFIIADDDRSEIILSGSKEISGIYAEDEIYGSEYSTGSDWRHTERLSGRYLSASVVEQITAQIVGSSGCYTYNGWSCSSAIVSYLFNIGDYVSFGELALPVLDVTFRFTAQGIIADMSAPEADVSFSEYHDLYSRRIEERLPYDKILGCTVFNRCGLSLISRKEAMTDSG